MCCRFGAHALAAGWEDQGVTVSKFRGNPWAVLLVVSLGFFMTLLDLTIVNIAICSSRLWAMLTFGTAAFW